MNIERAPVGRAAMLIRRPVSDVFEAFVNPAVTTKFWFSFATVFRTVIRGRELDFSSWSDAILPC